MDRFNVLLIPVGVYPRPRGGARRAGRRRHPKGGLSPPTRGSRRRLRSRPYRRGSIPAHAGEPFQRWQDHRPNRGSIPAHAGEPSVGERKHVPLSLAGLSPPTRGSRIAEILRDVGDRSIPAHAGEPVSVNASMWLTWVYPRPRGGACIEGDESSRLEIGLSPPTRGSHGRLAEGLINRLAGLSPPTRGSRPGSKFRATGVYPRPRGGACSKVMSPLSAFGLSPPTRGSHEPVPERASRRRSIPAHAGEPFLQITQRPIHVRGLSPPTRGSPGTRSPPTSSHS